MAFNVKTIRPESRFYLVEIEASNDNVITENQIRQVIIYNIKKFFGKVGRDSVNVNVYPQNGRRFIVETDAQNSVVLRTALSLNEISDLKRIHVLSEASTLQPLIHDSRLFFAPLEE